MQTCRFAAPLLGLALVSGCAERAAPPPPVTRPSFLALVPDAGRSTLADTNGTSDAERRTWVGRLPYDTAASFYRAWLPKNGWQLMSDRSDRAAGKIDLYARKGILTLWVHVEKQADTLTQYTLIGAQDSTGRAAPAPGRAP